MNRLPDQLRLSNSNHICWIRPEFCFWFELDSIFRKSKIGFDMGVYIFWSGPTNPKIELQFNSIQPYPIFFFF